MLIIFEFPIYRRKFGLIHVNSAIISFKKLDFSSNQIRRTSYFFIDINYLDLNVCEQKIACQLYAIIQGKKIGCLCVLSNHPRKTMYEKYGSLLQYL